MLTKKVILFCVLGMISLRFYAQVAPLNNDTINYTEILFSFPQIKNAEKYLIEISESEDFKQKQLHETDINAKIIKSFSFGKTYYWRYSGLNKIKKSLDSSQVHRFYIAETVFTNNELFRYRGKKKDRNKAAPGILFMDYGRVATNRAGKVIWYLPDFPFLQANELVRDLKLTNEGTITGLIDSVACEMDLNGNILWKAPDDGKVNGEKSEYYHHDLKKLPNGNFMVLGNDHVYRKVPNGSDSIEVEFGTVIEYDKNGNVVWSWNSNNYFTDEDLFTRQRADKSWDVNTHMNAFSTDGKEIYVGFRDISRILVIDKASGKVKKSYGGYGVFSEPHYAKGFFRRQHDAIKLTDGNYAVINNDSIMDPSIISSLVIFSPASSTNNRSEKIMDFKFNFDTLTNGKSPKMGNLQELEGGNILINMGGLNRCIEITREEEVVWDMFMERFDTNSNQWGKFPQYRINYSKSLYPYVFRSKIIKDVTVNKIRTITVKIYNVGGMDDNYTVSILDKDKKVISKKISGNILSGKSDVIKLSFSEDKSVNIHIESGNSMITDVVNP